MIKYDDLDKSKYFMRVDKLRNIIEGTSEVHTEYLLFDYVDLKAIIITEKKYESIMKNDRIRLIGREEPLRFGETKAICISSKKVLEITVYREKDKARKFYVDESVKPSKAVRLFNTGGKHQRYNVYIVEKNLEGYGDKPIHKKIDDCTLDFRHNFKNYESTSLMGVQGIEYSTNGVCILKDIEKKSVAVVDGTIDVRLAGSVKIEELILPESCMTLRTAGGKSIKDIDINIEKLYTGGCKVLSISKVRIGELIIGDGISVVYQSKKNEIGKIIGDLRLELVSMGGFSSSKIEDVVDLSKSDLGNEISLWELEAKKIILPETIRNVEMYIRRHTMLVCKGYLEDLWVYGDGVNTGDKLEIHLSNGASDRVKRRYGKYLYYNEV